MQAVMDHHQTNSDRELYTSEGLLLFNIIMDEIIKKLHNYKII